MPSLIAKLTIARQQELEHSDLSAVYPCSHVSVFIFHCWCCSVRVCIATVIRVYNVSNWAFHNFGLEVDAINIVFFIFFFSSSKNA